MHPPPRDRRDGGAPAGRPRLVEDGDPRTRPEVVARLDRLVANVRGLVHETDVATLQRIRDSAALALPPTDAPLDLADHETWLLRQICIEYLPAALEHYIALPPDLASEPVLDGRSAREVLDEQLALIESRLDEMATRSYRREASGLVTHARFLCDGLRPDPFQAWLDKLAHDAEPGRLPHRSRSIRRYVGDNGRNGCPDSRAGLTCRLSTTWDQTPAGPSDVTHCETGSALSSWVTTAVPRSKSTASATTFPIRVANGGGWNGRRRPRPELAVERRVRVPQPDEVDDAPDDGPIQGRLDLVRRVVVAVDGATFAGPLDGSVVVLAGEQADVVDLRDAAGEELDGPRRDVAVVVAAERRVVGAVELVDVDRRRRARRRGSG